MHYYYCLIKNINESKVTDITRGTCRLYWTPPESDGGERIKSYFVEKKTVQGKAWTKVNPACTAQSIVVTDLMFETEYLFRVKAENMFGFGPAVTTEDPARATDPIHPPDPPTRLKILNVKGGTLTLTWKAPRQGHYYSQ